MVANAAATWLNTVFAQFDLSITTAVHTLAEKAGSFLTPVMEVISFFAHDGIPLIIIAICLMLFRKTRRFGVAMLAGITIGALFTNCCLKILIARPRPYADETSEYYKMWQTVGMNTESDKSFPSGHTTAALASCMGIFLTAKEKSKAWPVFIFGLLIAFSRIYLCVHYPTDVIAGLIVGCIAGALGYLVMLKIPNKFYRSNKPFGKKETVHEKPAKDPSAKTYSVDEAEAINAALAGDAEPFKNVSPDDIEVGNL